MMTSDLTLMASYCAEFVSWLWLTATRWKKISFFTSEELNPVSWVFQPLSTRPVASGQQNGETRCVGLVNHIFGHVGFDALRLQLGASVRNFHLLCILKRSAGSQSFLIDRGVICCVPHAVWHCIAERLPLRVIPCPARMCDHKWNLCPVGPWNGINCSGFRPKKLCT